MEQMDLPCIRNIKNTQHRDIDMSKVDWMFVGIYIGWIANIFWRIAKQIYTNAKKAQNEQRKTQTLSMD